jgi:hypothetical protein
VKLFIDFRFRVIDVPYFVSRIHVICVKSCAVPSTPRNFRLTLAQADPPVVTAAWQQPQQVNGLLIAYRLAYGIATATGRGAEGDDNLEVLILGPEKSRFTTGFLGEFTCAT